MAASSTPPVSGMSSTSATMRAGPRRFPLLLLAGIVVISITVTVILSAPVAAGSARKLRQAIGHTAVETALGVVAILIGFAHRHAGQQPQCFAYGPHRINSEAVFGHRLLNIGVDHQMLNI